MYYPILHNIKNIHGNESRYFIDDACNVFEYDGIQYIPIHVHNRKKDGRPIVILDLGGGKKTYLAYRLLMRSCTNMSDEEFETYVVDHKDCDTYHNTYDNFELVSQTENMRRAGINNCMPYGEKHFNSKYKDELIHNICIDICNKLSRSDIMNKYNVNGQLIDDIRSGRSHTKISSLYTSNGFEYKEYDRNEKVVKAVEVCELLSLGNSVPQVVAITGYGYNFVYPIYTRTTFKDISKSYKF